MWLKKFHEDLSLERKVLSSKGGSFTQGTISLSEAVRCDAAMLGCADAGRQLQCLGGNGQLGSVKLLQLGHFICPPSWLCTAAVSKGVAGTLATLPVG